MDTKQLLQLRERTGAPITACQQTLQDTNGDLEKAVEILKKKGLEVVTKKAGREAIEGIIDTYIHPNKKVGVLIEVNCETDFVARTQDFQSFVHDCALQIAASDPLYLSSSSVPEEVIEKQKSLWLDEFAGKPSTMIENIMKGKLESWYKEVCLLSQPFLKNEDITIEELLQEAIAKLGENIKIKRFVRFSL